jgi:hypothetical protein
MAKKPDLTIVGPDGSGIPPPRKLGKHGMSLWERVQREYAITDAGGVELLAQACACTDRAEAIAAGIDSTGEVLKTRTGVRTNPAIKDETALRALVVRTLEKLGITTEKVLNRPGRPGLGPQQL